MLSHPLYTRLFSFNFETSGKFEEMSNVNMHFECHYPYVISFRLELPDGVMLCVKVKPNQSVRACLEPILSRQGLSSDQVIAHLVRRTHLTCHVYTNSPNYGYLVAFTRTRFQIGMTSCSRNPIKNDTVLSVPHGTDLLFSLTENRAGFLCSCFSAE